MWPLRESWSMICIESIGFFIHTGDIRWEEETLHGKYDKNKPTIYDMVTKCTECIECIKWIEDIGYIRLSNYTLYTQEHTSCKMYELDKENEKVVGPWKSMPWWQKHNTNCRCLWTHNMFSQFVLPFCTWHFLGNISSRCRFWDKSFDSTNSSKTATCKHVKFDTRIENLIIFKYYVVSINTFRYTSNHFWGVLKSHVLVCCWYISCTEFLSPPVQ